MTFSLKNILVYGADPDTKQWLEDHKHPVFGFPTLVRFSWGTCTPFFKDAVEVTWCVQILNFYVPMLSLLNKFFLCELQNVILIASMICATWNGHEGSLMKLMKMQLTLEEPSDKSSFLA